MNAKIIPICLAIVGVATLYFLSTLVQPMAIPLNEVPEYEGKQVIVEGIVTKHYTTSYESQIIELIDDNFNKTNFTITIYVEEKTDVEYGDKIQVTGKVQKYKGDWEIVVNDNRFVKTIQKWEKNIFPLWQIAENPERHEGININITGIVDVKYDTYFYLTDINDQHSIIVLYGRSLSTNFSTGDKVNVAGHFSYDESKLQYIITIDEQSHRITVVKED